MICLLATGVLGHNLHGQTTYTWTQTAGGAQSWNTGANWSGGSAPNPTASDTVDFSTVNIAADTTLSLDAARTAATWKFGDTSGNNIWVVNTAGQTFSGDLMITSGSLRFPTLNAWGGTGKNLAFTGNGTLTCDVDGYAGGTLSVSGVSAFITAAGNMSFASVTGSGTITYGNGPKNKTLTLNDASNYTGNLLVYGTYDGAKTIAFTSIADSPGAGNLQFGGPGSSDNNQNGKFRLFGNVGPVTFNYRRIELLEPTSQNAFRYHYLENNNASSANTWVINTPMTNRITGKDIELWLQGSNGGDNEFAGAISDGQNGKKTKLFKDGNGKWILSGPNTYTGPTTVNAGTLVLRGEQSISDTGLLNIVGSSQIEVATKERIQVLQFNGTNAVDGIWGATGYGAPNTTDRLIGNGRLYVNVPFPPKGTVIIVR
jgi:autotransporter-associated beta strand protein